MLSRLCLSSPTLRGIILLVLASFSLTVPSATAADHPELAGYTHDQIQRSCAYVSPFIGTDNPIGCLNGRLDVCTHILTSYRFGTSEDGKICRSAVEAKLLELQKADLLKMVDSLDRLLTGYALTVLPIPSSLPAWATNFRNIAPLPQIVIVVLVSIVLLGALLSYKPFPSPHVSQRIILGILIAIVAGPLIFFTPNFANPNRLRTYYR